MVDEKWKFFLMLLWFVLILFVALLAETKTARMDTSVQEDHA